MTRRVPLRHVLAAVALAAVLVGTTVYLYGSILGTSVVHRPFTVTVQLREAGGLFGGSEVTYRGVHVGSVDDVDRVNGQVVARVRLDHGTQVPANTSAAVRSLSPAGEQYLDLRPTSSSGPFLHAGSTIAVGHTSVPTTVAQAIASVDRLMTRIDVGDLRTVLRELRVAFADPDDLTTVVTQGAQLVQTLDETWPQQQRILENGHVVLSTGTATADDFADFAASAKRLTAWLKAYDPTLRSTLRKAPGQLAEFRKLVDLLEAKLPAVLTGSETITAMLAAHEPHLRELITVFPQGLAGLSSTIKDRSLRANLLISTGSVCSYGVDPQQPRATIRPPLAPDRSCTVHFDGQVRGDAHLPPPVR